MTEEYRKSYGKRIVNNGLHVVETDGGPILKDGKDRTISGGGGSATWGSIGGTLTDQTDLKNALDGKQGVATLDTDVGTLGYVKGGDVDSKVAVETGNRVAADTTLQGNIDTEATTRGNADTALGTRIDGVSSALTTETSAREAADTALTNGKLDATKATYQTTAPAADATDGGIHIVYLSAEPATKYNGYIYLIAE